MQYVRWLLYYCYIIVPKKSKKKNSGETVINAMFILNINDVDALSPHSSLFGRRILFVFSRTSFDRRKEWKKRNFFNTISNIPK